MSPALVYSKLRILSYTVNDVSDGMISAKYHGSIILITMMMTLMDI